MNVAIIGGGPAGCNTARLLALYGHDVDIYEEHKAIGSPIQCTGIVSHSIVDHIRLPDKAVMNIIREVRIHGPKVSPISIRFKKPNFILDRRLFDNHLADLARSAGAKIHLGKKMTGLSKKGLIVHFGNKEARPDIVIGADGPASTVANMVGRKKGEFWTGLQGIFKEDHDDTIDFFPFIGTLAWKVPAGKGRVRVGVIARKDTRKIFDGFVKRVIGNKKPIEMQGGLIPIYDPRQNTSFWNKKVFLLGDAAGQVKATTGGGIIQGLHAGKILASCIRKKTDYDSAWKKEIGKELWAHMKIREVLDKFSPEDYSDLISRFRKRKLKSILEDIEREYPMDLAARLLLKDPSLLTYLRFLF